MKKELDLKFACRRSEWHASIGDIMIPVNIKDLPEPEYIFDEYGQYKLYSDGTRQQIKNEVQLSTSLTFLNKDREDKYRCWNGSISKDIDAKKYYNQDPEQYNIDYAKKVYYEVRNYLLKNYCNNFYYCEVSRSRKGYHFLFYFNCDKTEDNFKYYNKLCDYIIKEAFYETGYGEIIDYHGVLDDCTNSVCQRLYITKYDYLFNDNCTGELIKTKHDDELERELTLEKIKEAKKQMEIIERRQAYEKRLSEGLAYNVHIEKTGNYKNMYIEHHTRYLLFKSLYYFFKDNIKEVWNEAVEHIPEENGHTLNYYKNCPFRNDWFQRLEDGTAKNGYNRQILEDFGYKVCYN